MKIYIWKFISEIHSKKIYQTIISFFIELVLWSISIFVLMYACVQMYRYPDISIELKWTEERKLALTDQISFVLVRSYYFILVSLYLADFFLSLSNASLVRFSSFAYLLRPADSRYYSIAISLARPAFFQKLSRSRLNEAIAQMLTRPERSSAGGEIVSVIWLGTYICYICNWKLYHVDEINRSRRLFRNDDV